MRVKKRPPLEPRRRAGSHWKWPKTCKKLDACKKCHFSNFEHFGTADADLNPVQKEADFEIIEKSYKNIPESIFWDVCWEHFHIPCGWSFFTRPVHFPEDPVEIPYLVGGHFSQDQLIFQRILWKSHTLWGIIFHRISPFSEGSCGNPTPCGGSFFTESVHFPQDPRGSLSSFVVWRSAALTSFDLNFILPGNGQGQFVFQCY
jgi:hypothetical protein